MKKILFCLLCILTMISYGKTINVIVPRNSANFVVTLPANPTTGYQWQIKKYNQTLLTLMDSKYIRPNSQLMGAGGTMQFTFALNKMQTYPKKTNIIFTYLRPWDPKSAQDQKVAISFK